MLQHACRAALTFGLLLTACDLTSLAVPARAGGRVADGAGLLDPDGERRIRHYLEWVSRERGIDYHVAIESLGDASPEERSSRLFAERGVGRSAAGHGLLLFVDPGSQQVRVEVGYALEPVLTDVDASRMLADYLAPYFRSGEPAAGVEASIEALIAKLDPEVDGPAAAAGDTARAGAGGRPEDVVGAARGVAAGGSAAAAARAPQGSGGAGASLDLLRRLPDGVLDEGTRAALRRILVPQPDPRQARDLEIALLCKGIYFQQGRAGSSTRPTPPATSSRRLGSASPRRRRGDLLPAPKSETAPSPVRPPTVRGDPPTVRPGP